MSGLLTLLDDVMGWPTRAGVQAAGPVIDDAAVTPKYVHGFGPARATCPSWGVARGSIRNRLVMLLPVALRLSAFAPEAIPRF